MAARYSASMFNPVEETIMGKTLYKRTHLTAALIFAVLMVSAGSAIALIGHPNAAAAEVPTLGRFIVSPKGMHFVAPAEAQH
jgi:hypothetical protein